MEKIPDLNLLLHLDALVRCANVSRAAEHLGITQSAMSAALSRLRRVFNDPLLVREANATVLTDRATALAAQFRPLLEQWLDVTLERGHFDPAQSRRIFTLYASDYVQFALLPALAATLTDEAPNISLSVVPAKPHHGLAMLESNHVEFVAGYYPTPGSTLRMRPLFEDQVVCIVREGHPSLDKDWSLDAWLCYGHIDLAAHTRNAGELLDRRLEQMGKRRSVRMTMSSYLAAPSVVARSDLIANLPESVALQFARQGFVLRPVPIAVPPIRISLYWHERYQNDAGHAWFRHYVTRNAKETTTNG
ncbi:LysR family transcriptional regulator [Paraburkholderia sp. SIMBA_053]|uniref:LysR family transcriptional regulator n=1 Tax=Paraburkholderia sp. SIMBA_053 TaxID=3085794 RepID=UPI00397D1314